MATLALNDDWKLQSDEHQWTLMRARWVGEDSKRGKELVQSGHMAVSGRVRDWDAYRYYPELSDGLTGFIRQHVMTSAADGVEAIRAEYQVATAVTKAALRDAGLPEDGSG